MNKVAFDILMEDEGGVSNWSGDSGGLTFAGITMKWFPKWTGWKAINKLLDEEFPDLKVPYEIPPYKRLEEFNKIALPLVYDDLSKFYEEFFYNKMWLHKIDNQAFCTIVFNMAVLAGKRKTTIKLQKLVGEKMDGVMGIKTYTAIQNNLAQNDELIYKFMLEMIEHYVSLKNTASMAWVSRVIDLYNLAQRR
jgi:lysozyme family protein